MSLFPFQEGSIGSRPFSTPLVRHGTPGKGEPQRPLPVFCTGENIVSSGRFGRTPVLASTAPATLVYALRNHYPTEMPGSQARVTPTPNERLEGQRCFAAHCDFMSRRRFVVGRCQIWRQSRRSMRSGEIAFAKPLCFAPPVYHFCKGLPSPHIRLDVVYLKSVCRFSGPFAVLPVTAT